MLIRQAIKEFSKSRLHYQALQEKHRQNSRLKFNKGRPRLDPDAGGAKRRLDGDEGRQTPDSARGEDGRHDPGDTATIDENDPLGLVRREIAIMKKLEYVVHLIISFDEADIMSHPNASIPHHPSPH
jgi:[calcium/calmodulin-dependent protein kinase] kinase